MQDVLNGVDRAALFSIIEAVKADASLGQFNFRLQNEWLGAGLTRSTVTDFHGTGRDIRHAAPLVVYNDEPELLLSGDKAPNPAENLLHALAGCLTSSIIYHAAARGLEVDAIRTRFDGDVDVRGFLGLSDDVRNGFRSVRVAFEIDGDLTLAQKRELLALGPRFSPVYDVVAHGTPVTCELAEDVMAASA